MRTESPSMLTTTQYSVGGYLLTISATETMDGRYSISLTLQKLGEFYTVQSYRGSPSASLQVRREMQSCTSGHLQGLDFAIHQTGVRRYYGIIAGLFYLHDEDYLTPQGTAYWRGVIYKHEVNDGEYDPMFVSIKYLLENWL